MNVLEDKYFVILDRCFNGLSMYQRNILLFNKIFLFILLNLFNKLIIKLKFSPKLGMTKQSYVNKY